MRSSSSGRSGRTWTMPPSVSTTSDSHCAGYRSVRCSVTARGSWIGTAQRGGYFFPMTAAEHALVRETGPAGLSDTDVAERVARGDVNVSAERTSRTLREIVRANIFTRFNAILGSMLVLILIVGPIQD